MPKYINADELIEKYLDEENNFPIDEYFEGYIDGIIFCHHMVDEMPSADVVEVGLLCEKIKADLDEAKESFSDCENESDKSFQQGRIFAHNYDLFVIERMLKNDGERKETE